MNACMDSRKIRLLLWSGCLAYVVFFAGDMLFYGEWGSARSWSHDYFLSMMASVAPWRHHLGAITGPVAGGLQLLGCLALWTCCRRAAPRLAAVMLAGLYVDSCFGILQHGVFGPLGFAIRHCGPTSGAMAQMFKLDDILNKPAMGGWAIGSLIWIFLALRGKACVPRWTVLFCPFLTDWLERAALYVPASISMPLWGGWTNFAGAVFFAVLALTYHDSESLAPESVVPMSAGAPSPPRSGP